LYKIHLITATQGTGYYFLHSVYFIGIVDERKRISLRFYMVCKLIYCRFTVMRVPIILFFLGIFAARIFSQTPSLFRYQQDQSLWQPSNEKTIVRRQHVATGSSASTWFDVTYYRLDLDIVTTVSYLKGKVTVAGTCLADSARTLTLDLVNQMRIDSVLMNGQRCIFTQRDNSFDITLTRLYHSAESLSVDIFYEGVPIATGLGSFVFSSHSGIPWVYSLSEPYGAKDWWPCKDDPGDKADSADILVTCDSTFRVASEGTLVSVMNNGDGTSTHHWSERYPIASYLISAALTNFIQFSNWFHYSETDSMEVLNYVLPEHYAEALQNLPRVIDMLKIYSNLFGPYPFVKEKYGHAEFGAGGAMEHQTMTSTTTFNEQILAHELAHQWFGDMITCHSWSELWLNEGFAQYATGLYLERQYGIDSYRSYMNGQFDHARFAYGIIGFPDTANVQSLFSSALVYSKGASVLHMLRHVLGDSVFFQSLSLYANNPALKYSTAATHDFQSVCESVSGKELDEFFQEWIYGEGYPVYSYSWTWKSLGDSSAIILDIGQVNSQSNPTFFTMPVDIQIITSGRDTTITVINNLQQQRFLIKSNEKPSAVILDPDKWILKLVNSDNAQLPSEYILEQNYPNPFNSTTNIVYQLRRQGQVTLKIFDLLGREIATLVDAKRSPGIYECSWTPIAQASGIYFYQLIARGVRLQKKMIFLK
jgi:aminopeptidase N